MREYELIIAEAFSKGLCPIDNPAPNMQYLSACLGFRCDVDGLKLPPALTSPIPITIDVYYSWPFPQMVTGEGYNILIIRNPSTMVDYVYSISDDHETVELIYAVEAIEHEASLMEVADFGNYLFMTNGAAMLYWDPEVEIWQRITYSETIPTMRAVCNFKGQAVGGCILDPWYDCDETYYVWSKIGDFDFTPEKGNEAGYRRDPYGGIVYHTKVLDEVVIGYSSRGITTIYPASVENVATFGFKRMSKVGLKNRGAVNGDEDRHVFVGRDNNVWEITKEGIKKLGYKSFIDALGTSQDIIVMYDSENKDFYIGNSTKTYLLSPYGMSESLYHPSTVWTQDGVPYSVPATPSDYDPYATTTPFDMGYRGQKTIFSIESDIFLVDDPEAGVDYTLDLETWGTGDFFPINDQGIVGIITAGNAFKFKLKGSALNDNTLISYLKARYKMTDMRGIRGVYAPPPRGQE